MCSILLKAEQSAFTQASLSSLSDVHECSGGLQMAPSSLDKQTANCDSPSDWLMSLSMNLVALYDMWRWKWHQWKSFGCFQWRRSLCPPLCGYLPTLTLPPCKGVSGIGYTGKELSKMVGSSASYPLNSWWIDKLQIAIESWQILYKYLFPFLSCNTSNN